VEHLSFGFTTHPVLNLYNKYKNIIYSFLFMGKECLVINPATGTTGSQSLEIDGKKGMATFGKEAALGVEKNPQAPCVLATWFVPENYKTYKRPVVRGCERCTRRVGFKPING
jgi:hypothetical protein